MDARLAELGERMKALESELELEAARRFAELRISIEGKRIAFGRDLLDQHRSLRIGVLRYLREARPLSILTAPVIYALIVPFALLDVAISVYQAICFRAYGIARVRRADYIQFDRSRLRYLNIVEKVNCAYCAYGNGVLAFAREVAARTELYWCPIKHARRVMGAHAHYADFCDFGDAQAYRTELERLRAKLGDIPGP